MSEVPGRTNAVAEMSDHNDGLIWFTPRWEEAQGSAACHASWRWQRVQEANVTAAH